MSNCPKIVNSSIPSSIVTKESINDVRVSTEDTGVGTTVNLSCHTGRTLLGPTQLTCRLVDSQARWSDTIPTCGVPSDTTTTGLTQQELIVIGVVAAICILVIIMVIVMLCACWYKRLRDRSVHKRAVSDYSVNTGDFDRYKPYSMYSPFPMGREGSIDRRSHRLYTSSAPRSSIPGSFPRTSHASAYELASRSTSVIKPKPYTNYAGPRIARASSDTYEDYLAERNSPNYRPYVVDEYRGSSYDNEGFRGEWTDRYDRKKFSDFNRDAFESGRDPFLWETRYPSAGF